MKEQRKLKTRSETASRKAPDREYGLEHEEIVAAVCKALCEGKMPSEIAELMRTRYGISMTREAPYKFIRYAASKGWLSFVSPREHHLTRRIQEDFTWLQGVEVVHTSVFDDVAWRTAVLIVQLLRAYRRPPHRKNEVHIGFAGGYSMKRVAEQLSQLLRREDLELPSTLVFHALVAGFDVSTPVTDPNAFFAHFDHPAAIKTAVQFVALHAPAIVEPRQMKGFFDLPGIKEARQRVDELDIIVSSAAVITDEHSMLQRYYQAFSSETLDRLLGNECVGDFLWLPLGPNGPVDNSKYRYRAMTLIELDILPSYIRRGTQVILALGPCGKCGRPKTEILDTILSMPDHLITHLVVDSRTARGLYAVERGHSSARRTLEIPGG
jgi:DNA-binding transcriptional regulator LsrR (DeoR family)